MKTERVHFSGIYMFNMKVALLLLLTVLNFSCKNDVKNEFVPNISNINEQFANEIKLITNSKRDSKQYEHVYFVKIFNGYIPIPNRFELLSEYYDYHHFESKTLPGSIIIGNVNDIDVHRSSRSNDSDIEVKRTSKYGLNITKVIPESEFKNLGKVIQVIIYGDSHYLSIVDTNDGLWEAMLNKWFESTKSEQ